MKDNKSMMALTSEKYNYLRSKQLEMKNEGLTLLDDEETPLIPEMEEFLRLPPPYEQSAQRLELSAPGSLPTSVSAEPPPAGETGLDEVEPAPVSLPESSELPPYIGE
jgi:hypothetical protein